ncbi:cytochrome C oxidase subunit IV family protein [Planctomycetaceae bacterium]|jgi:cytochrome c oxidase subunit IV|nr:cytochrome C oxidase subunit IV family protein [bacterium]MDB4786602.1 cytochrome C oxidase subunit IV family protein [Planctomycetaceae bacterium]MDC0262196.1 cytochrome C oxidase subunit IV family protein [Planctomycetaceae bacterium]MDC0308399.1 cytochrome C oxidase subunit IV family protein [Planctomycetaceae bacterium]MDG2389441.1 cytochrome C oxidase subunit IV family protein [Planctomycetaceae bacterium]
MAYRDTAHDDHSHGNVAYIVIFFALMIFTAISIVADVVHIPSAALKTVIVMSVAVAKATCVLLFFMHIKFEGNWKYILLAPTTILAIGLPIALMPDVATSYYIRDVPQKYDYDEFMAVHGDHGEEHSEGDHQEDGHAAEHSHDDADHHEGDADKHHKDSQNPEQGDETSGADATESSVK